MIIKTFTRHGIKFRLDEIKDYDAKTPKYSLMYYHAKLNLWLSVHLVSTKDEAKKIIDMYYKSNTGIFAK